MEGEREAAKQEVAEIRTQLAAKAEELGGKINELKELKRRIAEREETKAESDGSEEILRNRRNKYKQTIWIVFSRSLPV